MNGPVRNGPAMNRRLVRMLLALYPRPYRDRYGAEVVRLTEELIAAGEITPAEGALNLAAAAAAERGRALADSRRTAAAMALAALIALGGSLYATSHARIPAAASAPGAQHAPGARPGLAYLVRFACVVRSGKAARHPLVVPARMIGTTAACPALPAPCHARPGHPWPGQNPGTVLRVAVKPGQCIIAYQGDKPAAPGR
jgi:hypothetical protein